MQNQLIQLLQTAVFAPSGDNLQPWKFELNGNVLSVLVAPEKDPTLYNYKQRAAYISHGALIQNISICANQAGLNAEIKYFPERSNPLLTAKIAFSPGQPQADPLYEFISKRHTNRKPYSDQILISDQKQNLLETIQNPVQVVLIEHADEKTKAAEALCQGDRMIFENKTIHDFLFGHIRWNDAEVMQTKDGFNFKAMELAPPQRAAFRLFRSWPIMKFFNKLGFPKIAVKSNLPLYSKVSALVGFLIPDYEPLTFIRLGESLQKFWLTAASMGLSAHPLTGVPLLYQKIAEHNAKELSAEQIKIIQGSYGMLAGLLGATETIIGFFLRLGFAEAPTGTSPRQPPQIKIVG
jgi:hypothetical protein